MTKSLCSETTERLNAVLESDDMLDADTVIHAYCMLTEEVMRYLGSPATDCMCGKGGFNENGVRAHTTYEEGYRNDGKTLRFIVAATRAAMGRTDK